MAGVRLDAIDLKILDAVQRDGRMTKLKLAEKVGLSPTPCWMRLRKLEKAGIVSGYHARVAVRAVAPVAPRVRFADRTEQYVLPFHFNDPTFPFVQN